MSCPFQSVHPILSFLFGAACVVLAGCGSIPVQVNEGRITAKTFSFMEPKNQANNAFADTRAGMHASIQNAISRNLASKGLSVVDRDGDLIVAYLLVVSSNLMTTAINDYFGYGPENKALVEKAHRGDQRLREQGPEHRIKDPETYLAGTLVVDIIDSRTLALQYRNFAHRDLIPNGIPDEERVRRLQEAVDAILADLRVKVRR